MGLHLQQSHDLHDLDAITAPVSDGDYYLKVNKSGSTYTYTYIDNVPLISTGTAAPGTTPAKVGDIFVDTTNKNVYISVGTTNSSDWEHMNSV